MRLGNDGLWPLEWWDDEVHDRPGERQAAGLAGEAPDDLGPPPHLAERALEQVRGAQPRAQPERVGEMDGEGGHVVGQAGRGGGILPLERADQGSKPALRLGRLGRVVERGPVGRPDPLVEPGTLGELGEDVAQAVDGAALAVGVGPQLGDGRDQAGGAVGDDEQGSGRPRGTRPRPSSSQSSSARARRGRRRGGPARRRS